MAYPSKDGRVDELLDRVEADLPRFMQLVELEDVAALRSMLRDSNPHYDAACNRYGVPKGYAKEFATEFQKAMAMSSPDSSDMQPPGTSMDELDRPSAAERLKKKADEVAAGMDFHTDEHGKLFTTVKMQSDFNTGFKSVGVWLPPVGFEECYGDIFHTNKRSVVDAASVFSAATSAFSVDVKKAKTVEEIDMKELFGVTGAGTSSTYSYKPTSMAKSGKLGRKEEQRGMPAQEMRLVDLELSEICGRLEDDDVVVYWYSFSNHYTKRAWSR